MQIFNDIRSIQPGPLPGSFLVPAPAGSIYHSALKKAHAKTGHVRHAGATADGGTVVYFVRDVKALKVYHEERRELQRMERRERHTFDLDCVLTAPGLVCVQLHIVAPHFVGTIDARGHKHRGTYCEAHRLARIVAQGFSHETAYTLVLNERNFDDLMTTCDEEGMYTRYFLAQSILNRHTYRRDVPMKKVNLALKVLRQREVADWVVMTSRDPDLSPWFEIFS